MNEQEYLNDRLEDQIKWYDSKSQSNQKRYKAIRLIEIIAAASIPFLSGYIKEDTSPIKLIVGGLGFAIAIITAAIGLYQFQENWIKYRTACESLKREKFLFATKTEPYHLENPFPILVQRVEAILSKENIQWSQHTKSPQKDDKTGQ